MELHESLRELVVEHGPGVFDDAAGFRGILDDVLTEDQASTGDINLLVDAVRFNVLGPLSEMIDSGADPGRAVDEAGLRLARERGGDDHVAPSWAAAVLGYAVGKVPEAVVLRYRSTRPAATNLPPPTQQPAQPPLQSPVQPPLQSPVHPPAWPQMPQQAPSGLPMSPPPQAPPSSYPAPGFAPPPRKRSSAPWIAAAVAGIVLVGGGAIAAITLSGGDDDRKGKKAKADSSALAGVDVTPSSIDARYAALAGSVTAGASDCTAEKSVAGQTEVVQCRISVGTVRLTTYVDDAAFAAARTARIDYRSGTLSSDDDAAAFYEYDPDRGGTTDPALVYWDSRSARQSVLVQSSGTATIDSVLGAFRATTPRVEEPTTPSNAKLREFIGINLDLAGCTRVRTFFTGETEESDCESGTDGIVVSVGRYSSRKELREERRYYKNQYDAAAIQGQGPSWNFDGGPDEGAYYAYTDDDGSTSKVYWDWDSDQAGDCHCYGLAWNFEGDLNALEDWWPSS